VSAPDPDVALTPTALPDVQPAQLTADDAFLPRPVQFPDGPPTADQHIV
jgi:hypothetical protein